MIFFISDWSYAVNMWMLDWAQLQCLNFDGITEMLLSMRIVYLSSF